MPTQVTKEIDFTGKQLFIGLDVHKKSWSVRILVDGTEHRTFTQPPDPESLNSYLHRMFPGGEYNSAYEAGYCGYGIHRRLNQLGINNIVINTADIPTSQKDKLQKRDPVDSRKIARSLEKGSLHGIHSCIGTYSSFPWATPTVIEIEPLRGQITGLIFSCF